MSKLPLPAEIDRLRTQVEQLEQEKAKLLVAARAALEFMESVAAADWLEDGGPETIPEVEEFRVFLQQFEE
ncbi:MAG TPA: hypothetical protein VFI02_05805 [Armatimonadota bacterium]|nr:hypothetical protein [Armatimonadota bacterium]